METREILLSSAKGAAMPLGFVCDERQQEEECCNLTPTVIRFFSSPLETRFWNLSIE